jgi:uncharacterized protein (DUF58 family)
MQLRFRTLRFPPCAFARLPDCPFVRGAVWLGVALVWLSRLWLQLSVLLMLVGLAGGSGPLIGFAVFLFAAGTVANFWSRHALDRVSYERYLPETRAFPGETLSITMRLRNDKFLPLPWIHVKEPAPEGVQVDRRHVSPVAYAGYVQVDHTSHMSWYERISWKMDYKSSKRGHFRLGPARLQSGDLFGFFPIDRDETRVDQMIIYPKLYDLESLGLPRSEERRVG